MALGRRNVSVTRAHRGADVFGLAGFLRDDDLIGHNGSFETWLVARHGYRTPTQVARHSAASRRRYALVLRRRLGCRLFLLSTCPMRLRASTWSSCLPAGKLRSSARNSPYHSARVGTYSPLTTAPPRANELGAVPFGRPALPHVERQHEISGWRSARRKRRPRLSLWF